MISWTLAFSLVSSVTYAIIGFFFELKFMTEFAFHMEPPKKMQLWDAAFYSLDREDLKIYTKKPLTSVDRSWRQARLGVEIQRLSATFGPQDPYGRPHLFGQVYTSRHGDRMSSVINKLRNDLRVSGRDHDHAIAVFVHEAIKSAVDDLGICLQKNSRFLWELVR